MELKHIICVYIKHKLIYFNKNQRIEKDPEEALECVHTETRLSKSEEALECVRVRTEIELNVFFQQ